jgi:hypothetical protein
MARAGLVDTGAPAGLVDLVVLADPVGPAGPDGATAELINPGSA